MADTANEFMDRLVLVRDGVRAASAAVRRITAEARGDSLGNDRTKAAKALASGIKALGADIAAQAEQLERKL